MSSKTEAPVGNPVATEFFDKMRKSFLEKVSDEEKEKYQKFGEEFYNSFSVDTGHPTDDNCINMEESLAYVVESLKSGLHPRFLTFDEVMMVRAGYGEEWYKNWGYKREEIPEELLADAVGPQR